MLEDTVIAPHVNLILETPKCWKLNGDSGQEPHAAYAETIA